MVDVKESAPQAIPPVVVTVVGEPQDGSPLTTGTVGSTPDHQPNLVVQVVTPLVAILIRFTNLYLVTLLGLLAGGVTTGAIPASDFAHLVVKCAALSLAGPTLGLLKDAITILGGLEKKFPLLTGSV